MHIPPACPLTRPSVSGPLIAIALSISTFAKTVVAVDAAPLEESSVALDPTIAQTVVTENTASLEEPSAMSEDTIASDSPADSLLLQQPSSPDAHWSPSLTIGDAIHLFEGLGEADSKGDIEISSGPYTFLGLRTDTNVLRFVRGRLASISARVEDAEQLLSRLEEAYGHPRSTTTDIHSWISHGLLIEVDLAGSEPPQLRIETPRFAAQRIRETPLSAETRHIPAVPRAPAAGRQPRSSPTPLSRSPSPPSSASWVPKQQEAFLYSGTVKQSYAAPLVLSGASGLAGVLLASAVSATTEGPAPTSVLVAGGITSLVFLLTGVGLQASAHSDFVKAGVITPDATAAW